MSPEELLATVDLGSMEAFKQMDIYSMALVLWEIISRCEVSGKHHHHRHHHQSLFIHEIVSFYMVFLGIVFKTRLKYSKELLTIMLTIQKLTL